MIPYSLLDLAPVTEGSTPREAFANTPDLARHAEALGYHRYWLAEHHNMPGLARAATAVLIGHVAGGQIGRASCRERACQYVSISVGAVSLQKKQIHSILGEQGVNGK